MDTRYKEAENIRRNDLNRVGSDYAKRLSGILDKEIVFKLNRSDSGTPEGNFLGYNYGLVFKEKKMLGLGKKLFDFWVHYDFSKVGNIDKGTSGQEFFYTTDERIVSLGQELIAKLRPLGE